MPAPVEIGNIEEIWLKRYIKEQYDIEIIDFSDCKILQEKLNGAGIALSISTIRRIFGLVSSKATASKFSLDSLAKAIQFDNWAAFKRHVENLEINNFNHRLLVFKEVDNLIKDNALDFIFDLQGNDPEGTLKVKEIINNLIRVKESTILRRIFSIPFSYSDVSAFEKWATCLEALYFESKVGNQWLINLIEDNISDSRLLQCILLRYFVDEGELDGFFGKWVQRLDPKELLELKLFKELMICQIEINNKNVQGAQQRFLDLKRSILKSEMYIYPSLLGRFLTWDFILFDTPIEWETEFNNIESQAFKYIFINTICRLIWQYKDEKLIFPLEDSIDISKRQKPKIFFFEKAYHASLLILSWNAFNSNNMDLLIFYFLKINRNIFGVNDLQWMEEKYSYLDQYIHNSEAL